MSLPSSSPPVYGVSTSKLAEAIDAHYSSPLPDVETMFPWLHGLHPENVNQRAFLDPSRKQIERASPFSVSELNTDLIAPPQPVRGLLVVKVGSKTSHGTIIGTAYPDEILEPRQDFEDLSLEEVHEELSYSQFQPQFLNIDPVSGISLRNFQIQVSKWALVSDICLYVSDESERENMLGFAKLIAHAQLAFSELYPYLPRYVTCIVEDPIETFLQQAPHVLTVPPHGVDFDENDLRLKNWDSNFLFHEGVEMSMMSSASVIGPVHEHGGAVWLGNTADIEGHSQLVYEYLSEDSSQEEAQQALALLSTKNWTCYVRCAPHFQVPSLSILDQLIRQASKETSVESRDTWDDIMLDFPSSAAQLSFPPSQNEMYSFVNVCKLMYLRAQTLHNGHGASSLLFCNDGYTETSLLALAYIIYSTGVTADVAWIDLHCKYNRPFFTFPGERNIIMSLEPILLKYSPAVPGSSFNASIGAEYDEADYDEFTTADPWANCEPWFKEMDGSLPSRILSHLYLGSLVHAENPEMLAKIGIKRVISVGEVLGWVNYATNQLPYDWENITARVFEPQGLPKVMYIDNIQDNGMDPLAGNLEKCMNFLDEAHRLGEPTLVHCRVGVSRSATVCIAEVMKRLGIGLPRAYLFVRVRRLNVIIQPHLRFMYELMKWEEQHRRSGKGWLREVDWPVLCREIAVMNRAYIPG